MTIVWHNHQAPNYLPDNTYHEDWAFKWVWYDLFKPLTTGGPYLVHLRLLEKHDKIKVVHHLSPSLLKQWVDAIERGYRVGNGEYYPPDSREVQLVKEALEGYRKLASTSRVEFLSSVYAHTILGYIISRMNMEDIVREELSLGLQVTEEILGVKAKGVWTPEMAWDQRLVKIYYDHGIEYTVLCGKNHFPVSRGKVKKDIYMPYTVRSLGEEIKVFFRDQRLSDIIGFSNYFPDEKSVERTARRIIIDAVKTLLGRNSDGVVVLALDGENWMIFSKTPRGTYLFLDKLYEYMEKVQSKGILNTVTLSEALGIAEHGILDHIPTTSWLGSFYKWDGEIMEHSRYWLRINKAYKLIKAYEYMVMGRDDYSKKARWALYHALDSDYWWAEFWNKKVIEIWLNELEKTIGYGFGKIGLNVKQKVAEGIVGESVCIDIVVSNNLDRAARIQLVVSKPYVETKWVEIEAPSSVSEYRICLHPRIWGEYRVPVIAVSQNYVIASTYITMRVYPRIGDEL